MKIAEHFTTSDGQEFYKEDTARNHAKTLSNKKVTHPGEEIKESDVNDIEVEGEEIVAPLGKYEGPTIVLNQVTEGDAAGTDATGADATGADATGADATGADATGADATGSDATGADAAGTDATGADATGADATGADATGADAKKENKSNTKK